MQMQKIYAGGAASYARKITRPRDGTIVIKDWTGAILSGAAADPATGLVTGAAVGALDTTRRGPALTSPASRLTRVAGDAADRDGSGWVGSLGAVQLRAE